VQNECMKTSLWDVTPCHAAGPLWCFQVRKYRKKGCLAWRYNDSLKHPRLLTPWQSVTSQKTWIFDSNVARTWNLINESLFNSTAVCTYELCGITKQWNGMGVSASSNLALPTGVQPGGTFITMTVLVIW